MGEVTDTRAAPSDSENAIRGALDQLRTRAEKAEAELIDGRALKDALSRLGLLPSEPSCGFTMDAETFVAVADSAVTTLQAERDQLRALVQAVARAESDLDRMGRNIEENRNWDDSAIVAMRNACSRAMLTAIRACAEEAKKWEK